MTRHRKSRAEQRLGERHIERHILSMTQNSPDTVCADVIRTEVPLPFVTVATPFYNSGDTLARCIESVLAQTHGDFEYLLIDNRSTDDSAEVAKAFAAKDSRIRYIRFDEHIAQLPNYNRALRLMSSRASYCKVVQADDYLYEACLEEMLRVAVRHPSVGVVGAVRIQGETREPLEPELLPEVIPGREICRATLRGDIYVFGSQTSVMYRADLVRARPEFFNVKGRFADTDAVYDLLLESDFGFSRKLLTHTTRDPNSHFGKVATYDAALLYQYVTSHRIGSRYFDAAEAEALRRRRKREYYDRFVHSLWWRRGERREYLKFHRAVLRDTAGMRISILECIRAFFRLAGQSIERRLPNRLRISGARKRRSWIERNR